VNEHERPSFLMDNTATFLEPHGHGVCGHHVQGDECRFCSIRRLSVCSALDPDELSFLEGMSGDAIFDEKSALFREEDEAISVYNVTAGVVRLVRSLPDGRRQITGFALPGDFLGLALEKSWKFSAEAVTEVKACRFKRSTFEEFSEKKPHLMKRMHEFATHELSLAQDHMVLLGRLTAEEKIASFFVLMKRRWTRVEGHELGLIRLPMGRQDIADYLGLTIETVSRIINQMQRDRKLVIVPDGIRFVDAGYFEQHAIP
jgi:CRP/FNR family transcriptional regulator, anaerobic regulatory protein